MARLWITYAWADNEQGDVDFIAQELEAAGLDIKLDQWNLGAGDRLWDQIDRFISSEEESDAWLLVATNNSLASEPCREEYAYALDRALKKRGASYPVIALFLTHADPEMIPAGVRTRLYVSVTDPDWKERIVSAARGEAPNVSRQAPQPYYLSVHNTPNRSRPMAIEVRPRAGVWAPFIAAIPADEKESVDPFIMLGPKDLPTDSGMIMGGGEGASPDGSMWVLSARNQSTPTESYYIWVRSLPSQLVFGVNGNSPQYTVMLDRGNVD